MTIIEAIKEVLKYEPNGLSSSEIYQKIGDNLRLYGAVMSGDRINLENIFFIAQRINNFIKMPTDLIILDIPNEKIIERTLLDEQNGLNDTNDTTNVDILNARREAFKKSVNFLKGMGINIHWFEDVSMYSTDDLVKVMMGKIFG